MVTCDTLNQYIIGSASVITVNITKNGILFDPLVLTFEYEKPDGTIISSTYGEGNVIFKSSSGIFTVTLVLSQAGTWRYRWESTSLSYGAVEGTLVVNPSIIS